MNGIGIILPITERTNAEGHGMLYTTMARGRLSLSSTNGVMDMISVMNQVGSIPSASASLSAMLKKVRMRCELIEVILIL